MQISYNWLKNYLPVQLPIDKLSEILTNIGLEVEAVEKFEAVPGSMEGLVTGLVVSCVPHPNADKLKLTTVDVGADALLNIVCGAPNVAAGQKVIVATVGTKVHPLTGEAFEIKKAKIRGEASEGMICAEDEIGLGKSHDGIIVLDENTTVGIAAQKLYNIPEADYTIHIGLTPNRSDAMSHIGVARDVSAYLAHHENLSVESIFSQKKSFLNPKVDLSINEPSLPINIEVAAQEAAPRYAGIVMTGLEVKPSPEWMQLHLKAIGVRPINNIVDITNYVLHEYGQPLHAFDYDKIKDQKINVRFAQADEPFVTLDDKAIKLRSEDLMICDSAQPMCMAGVYGGKNSGVTEGTTRLFLESAYFNPSTIRRASLYHGLRTDAATHFEKSVDIDFVIPALMRAVQLIQEYAQGKVASQMVDIYPNILPLKQVSVKYNYINSICGKNYDTTSIDTILMALGFTILENDNQALKLSVPANKADVKQAADIAEEVLRIDGLNNIEIPERLNISLNNKKEPIDRNLKTILAETLTGQGFHEIVTNSITNSKYYPEHQQLVKMINSLSVELDIMRPSMLESGLEAIAYNANRKQQDLALYEIGDIYLQNGIGNYEQKSMLAIWLSGNTAYQSWQSKAVASDIYFLKSKLGLLLERCGVTKVKEVVADNIISYQRGKEVLATIQEVEMEKLKAFDIRQKVFYAEVHIAAIVSAIAANKVRYSELPKYPIMKRDLALVLDKSVLYTQVQKVAQEQKFDTLKGFELFDLFENEKLGADKKSLALSFTFQHQERTMTDQEVDIMMQQIIESFKKNLSAIIRE